MPIFVLGNILIISLIVIYFVNKRCQNENTKVYCLAGLSLLFKIVFFEYFLKI